MGFVGLMVVLLFLDLFVRNRGKLYATPLLAALVVVIEFSDLFFATDSVPAAILIFVGAKFVAQGFGLQVPLLVSLVPIAVILAIFVVSVIATHGTPGAAFPGRRRCFDRGVAGCAR